MCTMCQDGRIEFPKAPFIRPDGVIPPPLVRCVPPNSYRKKILLERSRNKSWVELTPDRFSCTTASLGPPLGGKSAYRMSPKTVIVSHHPNEKEIDELTITAACNDPDAPYVPIDQFHGFEPKPRSTCSCRQSDSLTTRSRREDLTGSTPKRRFFLGVERVRMPIGMDPFRYVTLFPCDNRRICLAFKVIRSKGPQAGIAEMDAVASDDGLDFSKSQQQLLLPGSVGLDLVLAAISKTHNMVHNVAGPIALPGSNGTRHLMLGGLGRFRGLDLRALHRLHSDSYAGFLQRENGKPRNGKPDAIEQLKNDKRPGGFQEWLNGKSPPSDPLYWPLLADPNAGIRMTRGPGWRYDESTWSTAKIVVPTSHPGCVDQRLRTGYGMGCEFDGRLSVVIHPDGHYLLYARANLGEFGVKGGRFVQVARSDDAVTWSDFQLVDLKGYLPHEGDVYFFAAQRNPVDEKTLIALFPLSVPPNGCIMLAFSRDGVRWSGLKSLVASEPALGGRTEEHPVAGGAILSADGRRMHVYVQEKVPGIARPPPCAQRPINDGRRLGVFVNQEEEKLCRALKKQFNGSVPATWIVRYSLDSRAMRELTREALNSLK